MSARTSLHAMILLLALGGLTAQARAATDTSKSLTYRWVDEQGVVHYGDSIPPQYAQKEGSVLNNRGVEIRRLEAQKTPEQLAADARMKEEILRQKQHDNFLLTTYTSVKDIEALRDLRLEQLRGQRAAAEQYVETLHSRLSSLQTRAELFKPYNDRPEAHRMPDDLAEELVRTLNEWHAQSDVLTAKSQEETALRAQFQADIERYRQLHVAHNE
jgi:Domain of unknown function (DUF4124)